MGAGASEAFSTCGISASSSSSELEWYTVCRFDFFRLGPSRPVLPSGRRLFCETEGIATMGVFVIDFLQGLSKFEVGKKIQSDRMGLALRPTSSLQLVDSRNTTNSTLNLPSKHYIFVPKHHGERPLAPWFSKIWAGVLMRPYQI
jgi:hypothetical protein